MVYEELEEKLLHIAKEINRNWENDKYQAFGREWMKQIIRAVSYTHLQTDSTFPGNSGCEGYSGGLQYGERLCA